MVHTRLGVGGSSALSNSVLIALGALTGSVLITVKGGKKHPGPMRPHIACSRLLDVPVFIVYFARLRVLSCWCAVLLCSSAGGTSVLDRPSYFILPYLILSFIILSYFIGR